MTICDLPGQANVAKKNAADAGFADRVDFSMGNVLEESTKLPKDPDAVYEMLLEGSKKANEVANQTLQEVREAIGLNYFDRLNK